MIPPYLRKAAESNCEGSEESLLAGPKLPSKQGTEEKKATERSDVDQDTYGPALPPGFQQRPRYIGPALPGRLKENRGTGFRAKNPLAYLGLHKIDCCTREGK